MGLGPLELISLAEARSKALDCRKLLLDGNDPLSSRHEKEKAKRLEVANSVTFDLCAKSYIDAHESTWKGEKHAAQWRTSVATYASPTIGQLPVSAIDINHAVPVLDPIWVTKTETAFRVRNRVELILDWVTVRGYRHGDNPFRWRGNLDTQHKKPRKVRAVEHHPARSHQKVSSFLEKLRRVSGVAPSALEFLILTACRTSEVTGARWNEINFDEKVWTIPSTRMKAGAPRTVPLSEPALRILKKMREQTSGVNVFSGSRGGQPLSNMAML
jgi:integrase